MHITFIKCETYKQKLTNPIQSNYYSLQTLCFLMWVITSLVFEPTYSLTDLDILQR